MSFRSKNRESRVIVILFMISACGAKKVDHTPNPVDDAHENGTAGTIVTDAHALAASPPVDAASPIDSAPRVRQGCDGTTFLAAADSPASRGPWPVGTRSITVAGLPTDVWYPAEPGSDRGGTSVVYDLRAQLPESQRSKVPDAAGLSLACDCYRDLPLDSTFGPFPVVVFVHGYTLFRTQSVSMMTHWASRGFVVLASDYPGITLEAVMAGRKAIDAGPSVRKVHAAIRATSGDLEFLAGRVATDHMGLTGHSMGGEVVGKLGGLDGVVVVIAMAEDGTEKAKHEFSSLIIGGTKDAIEPIERQAKGYDASPLPKRMLAIEGAGHMAFSDLCAIGSGGATKIALDHGVEMKGFVSKLARTGCADGTLSLEDGWEIIHYATTAALEEAMMCSATATEALSRIETSFPAVTHGYREALD